MQERLDQPPPRSGRRLLAPVSILLTSLAVLAVWAQFTPPGLLGAADAVGYAVCHRIDLRSFHIAERPLPLCSRCTGLYLGAVLGMFYPALAGRRRPGDLPGRPMMASLAIFGLSFAVDGLNSYLHFFPLQPLWLYQPSNTLRLITGTLAGLALGVIVTTGFHQSAWRSWKAEAVIRSWKDLAALLGLAGAAVLLVLTENPLLLYPLALISSAGVLVLLSLAYGMGWMLVLRRENRADGWRELAGPIAAGFLTAVLHIALVDIVRFLFTGTWSGFHF
jgi:uncharacterized membrane protein